MAIPRSMGWLVLLGVVVAALIGLSFLALDKPNVVWDHAAPHCPHCRTEVPAFSVRCPTCREAFDWVASTDEEGPWCPHCLSAQEDAQVRLRRQALGEAPAAQRVAQATGLAPEAATEWLRGAGRGLCGYCGGSGRDLGDLAGRGKEVPCPVCFGLRRCIGCDGDRRVRLGLEAAAREAERYEGILGTLRAPHAPADLVGEEVRRLDEDYVRRFPGTEGAAILRFWPAFRPPAAGEVRVEARAVDAARERLDAVLKVLAGD